MSFIVAADLIKYTDSEKVKKRNPEKLDMDIRRAEKTVLHLLNRKPDDSIFLNGAPEDIKSAIILYAEYYALWEIRKHSSGYKSESFDDYSYTLTDDFKLEEPDVKELIREYIKKLDPPKHNKATFKMRCI